MKGKSDGTSVERHKPMPFSAPFEHSFENKRAVMHKKKNSDCFKNIHRLYGTFTQEHINHQLIYMTAVA